MRALLLTILFLFLTGCAQQIKLKNGDVQKSRTTSYSSHSISGNYMIREKKFTNHEIEKIPLQMFIMQLSTPKASPGTDKSDLRIVPNLPEDSELPLALQQDENIY